MTSLKHFISIGAWNVCGMKNKLDDPDFIQEFPPHDINIVSETFSDKNGFHIQGFKCFNAIRKNKNKKARRNSGGVAVLIKDNLSKFIKFVRTTADHMIWLKISKDLTGYPKDMFLCGAYIPPNQSPYYEQFPDCDMFDLLSQDLMRFSKQGHIMIMGDLNSRIGHKSEIIELDSHPSDDLPVTNPIKAPLRCSMDPKSNTWGSKLIDVCIAHNLCMLNGRTLGDYSGRITYFGTGHSVIDLCIVDSHIFSTAISFQVHRLTEFSSHCKIETRIACTPFNPKFSDSTTSELSFTKYIWDPATSPESLQAALSSPSYISLKDKILKKAYSQDKQGTNSLVDDVNKLFEGLHMQSCLKIKIGRKSRHRKKSHKKRPWFTQNLDLLRNRVRRAANFLHRHPHDRAAQIQYISYNRQYRKLIKKAKKLHRESNLIKLINSINKNEMWSILSEMRDKKSSDAPIPMSDFYHHFSATLNYAPKSIPNSKLAHLERELNNFINSVDEPNDDSLKCCGYTPESITSVAKTLKNGKSAYIDGSLNEVIKFSISQTSRIIAKLFNHIELTSCYPDSWKSSFLVPLHKKGSKGDPDNYRGLAVSNNIGKLYSKCLNEKLKNFAESKNILSPHQFGFRDDFRTSDAIFSLRSILSHYKNNGNKPVYACFVDFSKAFDSVSRTALLYKLGCLGIKGPMLNLLRNMYLDSSYIIKCNGEYSIPLKSLSGVKQGCNLSPLLFNLFINDIHSIFSTSCQPVKINDWNINSLSFADDLVILSESRSGLAESLNKLNTYCDEWGLKINPSKTNVMIFNRAFSNKIRNETFCIGPDVITTTNSYCYLGVEITSTGSFHKATDKLYKKALGALYKIFSCIDIKSNYPNTQLLLKLFDTLIQPIVLYGSEIWGTVLTQRNNPLFKFFNKFYKTILGVPGYSSTTGVHFELGRLPVNFNVDMIMFKYWFRLISLPSSRLVSHCYKTLLEQTHFNDEWIQRIKKIIQQSGQFYIWDNQKDFAMKSSKEKLSFTKTVSKNLKDVQLQSAQLKMHSESKLRFLKDAKPSLNLSNYLKNVGNSGTRSFISKLRLGTTDLENSKGSFQNIPPDERFCKLCNSNLIENEVHFIFQCNFLSQIRTPHLIKLYKSNPFLTSFPSHELLLYLYFNENVPPDEFKIACDLLSHLLSTRQSAYSSAIIDMFFDEKVCKF